MTIKYMVGEAVRSFTRSKRLNLISLGAMSVSLMALGLVLVLNLGMWRLANFIEDKVEIVAFLNDSLSQDSIDRFLTKLHDHPQVTQVTYISKDQAAKEFEEDKALKKMMDVLGSNPLPASIRISIIEKTPQHIKEFTTWLNQFEGIDEVSYGGGDAERLLKSLQFMRLTVLLLSAALAVSAIIIIANIISLMVYARQEEISILLVIGATHWFIRGPFLIWGLLQGAAGGLVASGLLYGIWRLLVFYALSDLGIDLTSMLTPLLVKQVLVGAGLLVVVGALLGLIGSVVSLGRRLQT